MKRSAGLTSAVHAPADLTSVVHAPADLTSGVHDPSDLTSGVLAPFDLTSAINAQAALTIAAPTTVCCPMGVLPPGEARTTPAPSFSPHQTRPAIPLRPTAPPRSVTPSRRVLSPAPVARQAMSNEVSSSPSRSPVSAREYGSTPCGRSSGPASTACSPNKAARFPVVSEGQVEFEPPDPEYARL